MVSSTPSWVVQLSPQLLLLLLPQSQSLPQGQGGCCGTLQRVRGVCATEVRRQ